MITIIFGLPRVGKTALMTHFAVECMMNPQARADVRDCEGMVESLNAGGFHLTPPKDHLVFSDYYISARHGRYVSYHVNGFKFGLPNSVNEDVMFFPPFARFYLDEAQKYLNSRESSTFSDYVSRAYELHGHNYHEITLISQRFKLIDLNVRELTRYIQVLGMKNFYTRGNRKKQRPKIRKSVWTCREFDTLDELEASKSGKGGGRIVKYAHNGNIFGCYNSTNYMPLFYAGRENKDFDLVKNISAGLDAESIKAFNAAYDFEAPENYRKSLAEVRAEEKRKEAEKQRKIEAAEKEKRKAAEKAQAEREKEAKRVESERKKEAAAQEKSGEAAYKRKRVQ
jgi:hypothetical protein